MSATLAKTLLSTQENFTPFALELLEGRIYELSEHQKLICETLDKVISGEITRLIINIPPGFAKTAIGVWSFVARGFAINPASKFLHVSYSDTLVNDNSSNIRSIINSADYQKLYPYVNFQADTTAKGLWKTSAGGAFRASSSGGAVTGFRAGVIDADRFSGCLIIDDPLKPDDAQSDAVRNYINKRWHNVFRSRIASPDTPVVVIMQRLHEVDFTAYLLEQSGEAWHHLVLPSYIDNDRAYNIAGEGIPIKHALPTGSLWLRKFNDAQALALMSDGQYSQNPQPIKGEVFEREWFLRYDELPPIKKWCIYCDTASKTGNANDYSVFGLFGVGFDNKGYLIDIDRFKVEVPYLRERFISFYDKALSRSNGAPVSISVEDKDSGVGLIQSLTVTHKVKPISRSVGKLSRAIMAAPKIKDGAFHIPAMAEWVGDYLDEFVKFRSDNTHKNDDQIDPTMDFINFELQVKKRLF